MRQKSFIAAFLLLFCATSLWASDTSVDGIWYNIDPSQSTKAGVTYHGYKWDSYSNEYSGTIVIPETVTYNGKTYSVTYIDEYAFQGCSGLTSVTIPNSVTWIGRSAFSGCSSLTSVTIGNGVTSIHDYAFQNCSNLKKVNISDLAAWCKISFSGYGDNNPLSYAKHLFIDDAEITDLVIPNGVTSIGSQAFLNCSSLTSVTIPNSVTSIGGGAFRGCSGLTSVTIPNSVTSIGGSAFKDCSGLTSVNIGNSVTSINNYAFENCSSLTKVNILDLTSWCNISFSNSNANPLYYAKHLFLNDVEITDVVIPDGVTSVGGYAFQDCEGFTSVTIGNSVTSIGNYAFYGCSGLTSVSIPNSVTSIGFGALSGCSNLTSVDIPSSVTSIGEKAFYNIPNIIYSGTATGSPWGARNVNGIVDGWLVFNDESKSQLLACNKLANGEITIPCSVTSINYDAFYRCNKLTSIIWNAKNCADFTSNNKPFYNIGDQIISFVFGEDVEYIPAYLCYALSNLNSISIPNSVTSIGVNAFYDCSGLTSVSIGNSVTSIGGYVFSGCSSLTYTEIPNSVTSIGGYAFSNCSSLNAVTIGNSVTSIGSKAFDGCSSLASVVWNAKNCADFTSTNTPFYYYSSYSSSYTFNIRPQIQSFTFGEEVEHIPAYLCSGLYNLHSITIPNSVTSIGDFAFSECSGLTSLSIPNNITSIGGSVFKNCRNLTTIFWNATNCNDFSSAPFTSAVKLFLFGNKVEYIPAYLCSGLYNLTSITIPNSVTNIGNNAFNGCSGLTSMTIPNGVTSIGNSPFNGCSSLTSVIWNAKNCNDFSSSPFTSTVTSFSLGDEVEHIPAYLCYNMTSLPSINIPHSVTSVGENAFYGCKYPIYIECGDLERMKQQLSDYANYVQYESLPTYNLSKKATNGTIYTSKTKFTVCEEPIVTCTATANRGYQFVKWADGNTENPRTIELTQDTIMEALFEIATTGKCGRDNALVWKYDINTKALTITGEGELDANYTYGTFIESVNIGNGVTSIGNNAFSACYYLNSVTIPNTVTSIGYSAFYNCSSLTDVIIPNSVTSIGNQAFQYCANLITATIGNGVSVIGNSAFYNCSNLETVSLGAAVETIGQSAFYNCTRIIDIYCYANRVPEAYNNAFYGVSRKAYLWVPANRVRNYKTHEIWGEFDVHAIEADGVNTSTVKIVPTDNTAKIIWPEVEDAETYEITIYDQNGNIVCTLVFDSNGLLQSIAFAAPNRYNEHEAVQATGFRFEVTGLTAGTEYTYTIVAKDVTETIIDTQEGSFTTTGDSPTAVGNASVDTKPTKVIRDGQLFILRDGKTYTMQGQEVR